MICEPYTFIVSITPEFIAEFTRRSDERHLLCWGRPLFAPPKRELPHMTFHKEVLNDMDAQLSIIFKFLYPIGTIVTHSNMDDPNTFFSKTMYETEFVLTTYGLWVDWCLRHDKIKSMTIVYEDLPYSNLSQVVDLKVR